MRARALLGGATFLALILFWQRPTASTIWAQPGGAGCQSTSAGPLCDAVAGLTKTLRTSPAISGAGRLPQPSVPGATDAAVTQTNIDRTICRPGYSRAVRPAYGVTDPIKRRVMDAQYPGASLSEYELDHLIPISLGGAPLDARNLWLQPRLGPANAGDKNVLAYVLWRLVCEHRVPLATAQAAISRDWITAYQTYATPENVARYQFRHGGDRQREE